MTRDAIKSSFDVQKLVRCIFQCTIEKCDQEFETKKAASDHFALNHHDCSLNVSITQKITVIHSNDHNNHAFASSHIEKGHFRFSQLLYCAHDRQIVVTRSAAALHHQLSHGPSKNFEFQLTTMLMELDGPLDEVSMENASSYRFYLFECLECRLFFDSPDAVRKHHEEMNHRGDVRFMARK